MYIAYHLAPAVISIFLLETKHTRVGGIDLIFVSLELFKGRASSKLNPRPMATELHLHPLFQLKVEHLSRDERVSLSYQRARLVVQTYRK